MGLDAIGTGVVTRDFLIDVAMGKVPGHITMHKFGVNYAVGGREDIWTGSALYGFFPVTGRAMHVVSDDIADVDGGANAWAVRVYGLDHKFRMINEVVRLDGMTPVPCVNQYRRVYRMIVIEGGDPINPNLGAIVCVDTGDATVAAHIRELKGQTLQAIYTVPRGYTAYMTRIYVSVGKGKDADVELMIRPYSKTNRGVFTVKHDVQVYEGTWSHPIEPLMLVTAKSDIRLVVESATDIVAGGFDLLLVEQGR